MVLITQCEDNGASLVTSARTARGSRVHRAVTTYGPARSVALSARGDDGLHPDHLQPSRKSGREDVDEAVKLRGTVMLSAQRSFRKYSFLTGDTRNERPTKARLGSQ